MCARYALHHSGREIKYLFKVRAPDFVADAAESPTYNAAPTDEMPVIVWAEGQRQLEMMEVGLIPSWCRDIKGCTRPVNARADGILEKPYFRTAVRERRCLVPMSGYYEWQKVGKQRLPYYLRRKDKQPFLVAGLWEHWKSPVGPVRTFATVTVESNEMIAPVHHRMLVVLEEPEADEWLDPRTPVEVAVSLLQSRPLDDFEMYRVTTSMNRIAYNGPHCIAPLEVDDGPPEELNLFSGL